MPFNDQPKSELFRTASLERATTLLNQSAALRSLMLLSGENGVGKSAVAGRWLRALEAKAYFPVCITQASLTGVGLLGLFLQKLGKAPRHQHSANLKLLEEAFSELGRLVPVLLLDEAQNYALSALEELRMLLGLNLPEQPAFALILVGDCYLLSTLRLRSHRALYSRIAAHARLEPLSRSEVEPYLEHQLRQVGIERSCFEPAAVELLASASEGIPRTINLVARAAWLQAAQAKSLQISAPHVQYEFLRAGFSAADLKQVVSYLQKEIRTQRRNVGALKLSNLLQLDRFEEDLHISRVRLKPPVQRPEPVPPSPVPAVDDARGTRLLEELRTFRQRLRRGEGAS